MPKAAAAEAVPVPVSRSKAQPIQVKPETAAAPMRTSLLPIVGGILAWGWRVIVPQLAEYFLYGRDRRAASSGTTVSQKSTVYKDPPARGGGGRRQRRRRRQGG